MDNLISKYFKQNNNLNVILSVCEDELVLHICNRRINPFSTEQSLRLSDYKETLRIISQNFRN